MNKVFAEIKGIEDRQIIDIDLIKNGTIAENNITRMWCTHCNSQAHIYHYENGAMSFRCKKHKDYCSYTTIEEEHDEKLILKRKTIRQNMTLNNDLILYGNDKAPSIKKAKDSNTQDEQLVDNDILIDPDGINKLDTAVYYVFSVLNIECTQTLFNQIKTYGYDFNMCDGRTAGDLLLDDNALHTIRRSGFEGLKIALTKRCTGEDITYLKSINAIQSGYDSAKYTYLKDAFASNIENALIFKVRCKNPEQNSHFKDLIMGSKKNNIKRDPREYIVIYTYFKKEANDFIQIYSADITFRQYALFKDIKIGNNQWENLNNI